MIDIMQAMAERHSVRQYTEQKIEGEVLHQLQQAVEQVNQESGLHFQLCVDEPQAFTGLLARYGRFTNVRNYFVLAGPSGAEFEVKYGYYGEKLVLLAQQLGLNTCWVAATYKKGKTAAQLAPGESLRMVISLGYGATQGVPHKNKPFEQFYQAEGELPPWFRAGVEAAMLAPTAINQQKFRFILKGNQVKAVAATGPHSKVDLGIAKYHFELGAGDANWQWAKE